MTNPSHPPRVALYLRLSVASDEESTSIERQEADLRALAQREGWDVVEVFTDDGFSGRKERAKARAAVEALRVGAIDVLAVWKFDRFSREGIKGLVPLLDALEQRPEAVFVALQDGLRSGTTAWEMLAPILATFARIESNNTAARVRSAIASNRAAGRWTGGPAPVGYVSAPNPAGPGRVLVPARGQVIDDGRVAPDEVTHLVEAAERIVSGQSLYAVTGWLNTTAMRPRRARSWSIQAVSQVLSGTAIVGQVKIGGEVLRDSDGVPREVFEPALPVPLWRSVRAVLAERATARVPAGTRRRGSRSRLLSGLAVCASCGAPLYVRQQQNGEAAYRCASRSNGRPCTAPVSVTAARLEEFVAANFLRAVGRLPILRPAEVEPVEVERTEVEDALRDVAARLGDPNLSEADEEHFETVSRHLRARLRALRGATSAAATEVALEETGETYADVWARLDDVAARREHLVSALASVEVSRGLRGRTGLDPARVSLRWADERDARCGYLDDPDAA